MCVLPLALIVCMLMGLIMPAQAQVKDRRSEQPNEIRSGRSGVDFGRGRSSYGHRGSEYRTRRYNDNLFSSNEEQGNLGIGVTAAAAINWQTRDAGYAYDTHYNGRWGAAAGIMVTYRFFDWMSLRADIQYAQKNYQMTRMSPTMQSMHIHTDYMHHYIQVPVMVDWTFGSKVKSHIYTGGYGGFWLGGNVTRISVVNEKEQNARYEFSSEDNRADGGIAAGVGVTYDVLPSLRVGAEAMLYYSLVNTVKRQPVMNDTRYNNTVTLGVIATYIL